MPVISSPQPYVEIKALRRSLVSADDTQVTQIVALIDAMAERGPADALLVPLRSRWKHPLPTPRRPLGFSRLLFIPVDPIIVPPTHWNRHALSLPRTTLFSLARQVQSALGPIADEIATEIAGHCADDQTAVLAYGSQLWSRAAAVLATAAMPADWPASTGLNAEDHLRLSRALATLLARAETIERMVQNAEQGAPPSPAALRDCLAGAIDPTGQSPPGTQSGSAQSIGMLLAVMLARLPCSDLLITTAGDLANSLATPLARQSADAAIDFVLDQIEADLDTETDLPAASLAQGRIAALLDSLEGGGPASRPIRKNRAVQLRRKIDQVARTRFSRDLSARVLASVAGWTPETTDADINRIEATARDLRRFETASRALGGADYYERILKEAAQALADTVAADTCRMDVARLVEILHGPEAGLAVLRAA